MEAELDTLRAENARLRSLLGLDDRRLGPPEPWKPTLFPTTATPRPNLHIDAHSSTADKAALFRSLFVGRDDVYAVRWDNERTGKSGWSPAVRGGPGNSRRPDREYVPYTDTVVNRHLGGHFTRASIRFSADTCRLLVCDFDRPGWVLDALAYLDAAHTGGIPAAFERSRSGDGGHVWVFFDGPVLAAAARRIGVHLLREAMTVRAELDLVSYDRLFPTQDFMPKGSFGNLIALPLQGRCCQRGTTVFLDPAGLKPYDDQWAFLSGLQRLSGQAAKELADGLGELAAGPDAATFRHPTNETSAPAPPARIVARAGAMLAVDRIGMPPAMLAALKHLASLHNPEFYEKEKLRFSTWNTPRFIRCYRETLGELLLPRGLREKAAKIVGEGGSELVVVDDREEDGTIDASLRATLTPAQMSAAGVLTGHDLGTLVAPPGSGKTVIGCALIAHHRVPALVLVDREPLVDQWRERLVTLLDLDPKQIGQVGGGRNKQTGIVDVAMVQSLARREDIAGITSGYGLVVVDECHHVPAVTFERAVRQIPARRWLGLTATPYRRDGLQAMMSMHCGTVRHTMPAPAGSALRSLALIVHETDYVVEEEGQHIQATYRGLVEHARRTVAISADVEVTVSAGRNCLVLTRWKEHLDSISELLRTREVDTLVMHGKMGKKARAAVLDELGTTPKMGTGLVLGATASLIGEGFDCPPLDTLFLAFPIRFKGNVVQYVGRVLRPFENKTRIEVHDYVDVHVPVLARMHDERRRAYASLGFDIPKSWRTRLDVKRGSLRSTAASRLLPA